MAALKLKRILIRNWAVIRDAEIEFPDHGLVLVVGDNKASDGFMQSVGSGKTAFGEALCRTLLGCAGRVPSALHYSTGKKGNTFIEVESLINGQRLQVDLGYKCKEFSGKGESLRYHYGDQDPVERATLAQTRDELAKIVNIEAGVADWTVLVDGDRIQFNQLSQQDSVRLLMSTLNQPPWTSYQERARSVVNDLKIDVQTASNGASQCETNLAVGRRSIKEAQREIADEKDSYEKSIQQQKTKVQKLEKELEDCHADIEKVETRRREIEQELKEMEKRDAHRLKELEMRLHEQQDRQRAVQDKKNKLLPASGASKGRVSTLKNKIKALENEPDNCPECGSPLNRDHSKKEIEKLGKQLTEALADDADIHNDLNQFNDSLQKIEDEIDTTRKQIDALSYEQSKKLSDEDRKLERALRDINRDCRECELELQKAREPVSDTELQKAQERLKERQDYLKREQAKLEEHNAALEESEVSLKVAQYWYTAFGPYGIPNMLLEEAIKPLNEVSRALSKRLTGSTLAITYGTKKLTASGKEKSELIIDIENKHGSTDARMGSKGERGLTNFFISETLAEVGRVDSRIGFRWYDEVVPHQDAVLCRTIYDYMRETAHRKKILIFLVDHNPIAENYADHVLVVEKHPSGSKVLWR